MALLDFTMQHHSDILAAFLVGWPMTPYAMPETRALFPIDELQADLDAWIGEYNERRLHQGRWCFGKTPMQTFLAAMPMTKEKMIAG